MTTDHMDSSDMNLDEQIGQLLAVGFYGTTPSQEITHLIQHQHIGGIILFSRNIQDTAQVLELTNSLQAIAKEAGHRYPLLIMTDQENGLVRRLGSDATSFPGSMALGATGSEQLVYDVAYATGQELHALGITMNLAPVADVNNNPSNPVIGVRSFGEDPQQVARMTVAAVRGYHDANIITCLKHFPGHGDTTVDSHYHLPVIPYNVERLTEIELVPFKSGIAAGADTVMTAHISFPHIFQDNRADSTIGTIATLSPAILQGLLREQLGFDGVIVSDSLEMRAISETIGVERGAVLALQAGADLLLVSHYYAQQLGSIQAIREAVATGQLSLELIGQAAQRILQLKARYLSWDTLPRPAHPALVGSIQHQTLSKQAYDKAITVVRDEDALLPLHLSAEKQVLILYPDGARLTAVEDRHCNGEVLAEIIKYYHPSISTIATSLKVTPEEQEHILQQAKQADLVLAITTNSLLYPEQSASIRQLIAVHPFVIGIAVYTPYDLLAFPMLRTYITTYEYSSAALTATARVLFGVVHPMGYLPVSLPGLYPAGHFRNFQKLASKTLDI